MARYRTPMPDYEALPEVIKGMVSPEEYRWKSEQEKAAVIEDCTTPDLDTEEYCA